MHFRRSRRTAIENAEEAVYKEKEIEETDVIFLMDRFGYVKTIDENVYERNKEAVCQENRFVFKCKNTGKVCLFTENGQLHTVKVMDIPFGKLRDKSIPVDNISTYSTEKERIIYAVSQAKLNQSKALFFTKQGMCKIVDGSEFDVAKRNVAATKLQDDDTMVCIEVLEEQKTVLLKSKDGYFLRFPIEEIPEKKKTAVGVRAMKLKNGDELEVVYCLDANDTTKLEYKSKELELNKIKLGKRDSNGVKVRA